MEVLSEDVSWSDEQTTLENDSDSDNSDLVTLNCCHHMEIHM